MRGVVYGQKLTKLFSGNNIQSCHWGGGDHEIFAMNETRQPSTMRKNDELVFRK